jgi:transcriptional regulator with XRE-family HTH domain
VQQAAVKRGVAGPAARKIGENIERWRRRQGQSQAALAAAIGCDRSVVCRWEAGVRTPTLGHLLALGRALGCGAADLLPHEMDG